MNRVDQDKSLKHWLKIYRWQFRRYKTALRWGSDISAAVPAVLGNAMPKSGSHLIIQILQGLTRIGPFVNPGFPPVNRTEDNRQFSIEGILENIANMRPGDIGYGYLDARDEFVSALTRDGLASIFVYRDPRDMIISHIFYATEIFENHGMHDYYTKQLSTMEERINAAIGGVQENGLELMSVTDRYDAHLAWLDQPGILCIRFEDLRKDQGTAYLRILKYLESKGYRPSTSTQEAVHIIEEAVQPKKSGTFRFGRVGDWRQYFTQVNVDFFKQSTGDLLQKLGYEQDDAWSL
ncbi:MAG: sulfotransferase domain-containing protein [Anaerolineales bacterium]